MNLHTSWPQEDEHDRREETAYHEAGHCLLAWLRRVELVSVTATPDEEAIAAGISDGFMKARFLSWDGKPPPWKDARDEILIALAGPLAAAYHGGFTRFSSWLRGGRSDYRRAQGIALRYLPTERAKHLLDVELRREAKRILREYWPVVRVVAERLIRGGVVSGHELEGIMNRAAVQSGLPLPVPAKRSSNSPPRRIT